MKKISEATRILAEIEWLHLRVDGMLAYLRERKARKHKGGVK